MPEMALIGRFDCSAPATQPRLPFYSRVEVFLRGHGNLVPAGPHGMAGAQHFRRYARENP